MANAPPPQPVINRFADQLRGFEKELRHFEH